MTTLTAAQVWRDYETDGVPSSGAHKVKKSDARELLTDYELRIGAATPFGSRAAIKAATTHPDGATVYLTEVGREGRFVFRVGDLSAFVTADTQEGVYLKADDTAASSGAWVRVTNAIIDPSWFGFQEAGTASQNVTAFNAMLALVSLFDEAYIRIRSGLYLLNAKITYSTGKTVIVESDTIDGCILRWTSADGGIDFTYTDHPHAPTFIGLNLETTQAAGGTALKITGPDLPTATEQGPKAIDIDCRGEGSGYWTTGIHFVNSWHPQVVRPDMKGADFGTQVFPMSYGIRFTDCQAPAVRDLLMFHMDTAIAADGSIHGEGVNIGGGEIVGVNNGIVWAPEVFKPGATIHDLHINAYRRGIHLANYGQLTIHDCLIYKTQLSTQDWVGIDMANCHSNYIHHVRLACPAAMTGNANGIVLANCEDNTLDHIQGDQWNVAGTLVILAGSSDRNHVDHIVRGREATLLNPVDFISLTGTANLFDNIAPSGTQTLAANSTTPSVGNDRNGMWKTANTAATAITTFTDSKGSGHTIKVRAFDANTSLVHNGSGTGIFLRGGVNVSLPIAQTITLVREDNAWVETGRSF
ncbi:hypothetical protein [Rhizobium ruizarguesonis]